MPLPCRGSLLLGLSTLSAPLAGQSNPRTLSTPQATFTEPFTAISGVRELTDGRVLVSDLRDKIVLVIDLAKGTTADVGREGQGPGEYSLPASLIPLPGGESLLQDYGNQRFLSIGADGTPGRILAPPRPAPGENRGGGMVMMGALMDPRGVDAQGNLYFQGMGFTFSEGAAGGADSVPILRWDRVGTTFDTVAWVPVLEESRPRVTRSGGDQVSVRIGGNVAWPKAVQWGVASDGRIAMVTPDPYRVSWLGPRGAVRGPEVPYAPIRVTEAEKKEYREAMSRATPIMVSVGVGGGRSSQSVSTPRMAMPEPEWPGTMPPFTGRDAVRLTPEGDVWVARTRKASDRAPRYDVFDRSGRLTAEVRLRPRSRVVGFGKGVVYVVRMDEDDLQYLERFAR